MNNDQDHRIEAIKALRKELLAMIRLTRAVCRGSGNPKWIAKKARQRDDQWRKVDRMVTEMFGRQPEPPKQQQPIHGSALPW